MEGAKPVISGDQTTYSYLDSHGVARTETRPRLTSGKVIELVQARMARFDRMPPGVRESDSSRKERKYIAAQPETVLRAAWGKMNEMEKMEFGMMLDRMSHYSLSDPKWVRAHAHSMVKIMGDDGLPLNGTTRMPIEVGPKRG